MDVGVCWRCCATVAAIDAMADVNVIAAVVVV